MVKNKKLSKENKWVVKIPREGGMLLDAFIFTSPSLLTEDSAIEQLKNAASIPSTVHISATPDIHQGYGVPIGAVLGTTEVVVPAAVGYDINCGMRMLTTGIEVDVFRVEELASALRREIPLGEGKHNIILNRKEFELIAERGVPGLLDVKKDQGKIWEYFDKDELRRQLPRIEDGGSLKGDISSVSAHAIERGRSQLATLGGGNHFVEIQRIEEIYNPEIAGRFGLAVNQIAIMIHTGSRGFGHQIGGEYMKTANKKTELRGSVLARKGLGYLYLDDREGRDYLAAMNCGANFAFVNRFLLNLYVKKYMQIYHPEAKLNLIYDVPHNILKIEDHYGKKLYVHRKGATRAFGRRRMSNTIYSATGQPVLIPGSMGTASYVLAGVDDNERSLASVNHGAGRVMSRTEAIGKRKQGKIKREAAISDEDFRKAMEGIILYAEDMRTIKEEAPQAYKDIDQVIEVVTGVGLAEKVARVRPLAVLKG